METEQIVFKSNGDCASFVQIRGSIPLYWRQNVRIKYKPELQISAPVDDPAVQRAFRQHRDRLLKEYGRVQVANLVDLHGGEGTLAKAFCQLSHLDEGLQWHYHEFDFHHQCRKMAYHNIQNLVKAIEPELDMQSYFEASLSSNEIRRLQKGVVRTNCMDCLDRTNVVQSVLAKRALFLQLVDLGIVDPQKHKSIDSLSALSGCFKNVWADNADAISTQYSGTGALKTDFTRTGKRSFGGVIQDGVNSALRYYFGNCSDGARQDGLDLLFGAYKVEPGKPSPFLHGGADTIALAIWWMFWAALSFVGVALHLRWWLWVAVCLAIVIFLGHYIRANGKRFAQYPRLNPPPASVKARTGERAPLLAAHNKSD